MNRDGFLLGFLATGGQVLLLRELVASFGGSELLIGIALSGWLLWVAAGAWWGGRRRIAPGLLFVVGVFLLPLTLIATRLAPLVITDVVGEMIPLSTAFAISILMAAPVGLISGCLFPVIAQKGDRSTDSVVSVYLHEGLGAFAAGIIIVLLVGNLSSNLGTSLAVGVIVLVGLSFRAGKFRRPIALIAVLLLVVGGWFGGGNWLDNMLDRARYPGYAIEQSFDTHYGHQTVLSREGSLVLLTDNSVEAGYPDLEAAENLFIPPLIYRPGAKAVLYIGRTEFGVAQLAGGFPDIRFVAVDPRTQLSDELDRLIRTDSPFVRVSNDPTSFLSAAIPDQLFDIIILNPGSFDSYRNSRFVTAGFLKLARRHLSEDGVFFLPTSCDTDRYVTADARELLSIIYHTLADSFDSVIAWPGTRTLLLASDGTGLRLPLDTMIARSDQLPYKAEFISDAYLADRLGEIKVARLRAALTGGDVSNSIARPILATIQSWYRAKASTTDRQLLGWFVRAPYWLVAIPVLILLFFWRTTVRWKGRDRFGLFLYFVAGLVSLSLELIAFYTYQSSVGSLYSEIAVLIGTFMLGLALGTYASSHTTRPGIGRLSLATILAACLMFMFTWNLIDHRLALVYHVLFLFVVALATGSLFVAATRRYFADRKSRNRGTGYACELVGSAIGALLTTTILLPVIGLQWLLVSIAVQLVCALVGLWLASLRT